MRWKRLAIIAAAVFACAGGGTVTTPAQAVQGIPYQINFQGRLADATGAALADGSYNIKFRIWDASTGGTNLWQGDRVYGATDYRVTVSNGLFTIQLGDTSKGDPTLPASVFSSSNPRYLEVEMASVATNTCASNGCAAFTEGAFPRQVLASSPYAYNSDTLDGLDSAAFGQVAAANTFSDTNTFSKAGGAGIVLSGSPASGGALLQMGSALVSGNSSGTLIGANTALTGDLINLQVSGASKLKVDNSGNLTLASGTAITIGASAGVGTTCTGGQMLQNQTTVGGIVTGGTCAVPAGTGANVTLSNLGTTSINADLLPSANNTRSIGSAGLVWANLYATNIDAGTTSTTLAVGSAATTTALTLGRSGLQVSIPGGLSSSGALTTSGNISTTGTGNITAAGNLIVGSTNSERVTVSGTGRQYIQVTTTTAGAEVGLNYTNTAGSVLTGLAGTSGQIIDSGAANDYIFNNRAGGILFSADSAHNRKDIYVAASTGNVGIGSGTTGYKLDVAGDVNTSGVYRVAGTAGVSSTCSGSQVLLNPVTTGGITTGGTCSSAAALSTLQNVYDASSTPAAVTLATGKNLVVTSPDVATDPNITFNLQCTTCSASGGQFSVQDGGTDVFVVAPTGQVSIAPSAGQNLTITQPGSSGTRVTASSVPTVDQLSIDNTSTTGVATAGVNGMSINYKGGAAAVEASGMRVDYAPGTTSGGTWSGLRIVAGATGAAAGVTEYGLKLEGPTSPGAGTETGTYVGTGWDIGVDVQSGGLQLAAQTDPTTPAANNLRIYAKDIAGRIMPKWVGPSGVDTPFQASLGFNRVAMAVPNGTANCSTGASLVATTLATAGTCTVPTLASTNLLTSIRRLVYPTTAVAGNVVYQRQSSLMAWRGNAAGLGGFFYTTRFGTSVLASGNRAFVGLSDSIAAPTNVDPTTATAPGKIGMAINASTGNWNIVSNVTGTAPTVTALGASFPVNTTSLYELVLFSAPNGSSVGYRVTNISTGATVSGSISTNLPASNTFLNPIFWITNNATGAIASMDWAGWYLESDN